MINLTVVIDNDEALKKLKELQKVAKQTTSSVVNDSERMDEAWNRMKTTIGGIAAGYSFIELSKQVVNVRGEVQQLEVAFETMLGSKQKSDALMAQMVELAAKTPFGLQDVTDGAKNLLAFGSTAEDVAEEITMLGDIAAGLSIPLGDLIYLYGTTRTQGGLFTQDLKQFMGRGIPLADELAKVLGKTSNEVREMVSAGKIGFPEVQEALKSMTSEGGKFGGLMEKQSQTITGQISALEDAIYNMFNKIGESNEGFISAILSSASWVVEHYEPILKIVSKLVIAWGAYKAALIVVAATQKIVATAQFVQQLYNVAKGAQTAAQAFRVLNTAMKSNPWGLIASIAATVIAFIWDWVAGVNEATEATGETARVMGELEQAAHDEYIEVNKLAFRLKDVNTSETERREILKQLKDINPSIVDGLNAEALAVETLTSNLEKYNFEQTKRVQLAAITDKQAAAASKYGKAELKLADLELDLKKYVDGVIAEYQTSGKIPEMEFTWTGEYNFRDLIGDDRFVRSWENNFKVRLENAIKYRMWGQTTDYQFLQEIADLYDGATYIGATTSGENPLSDILSYDIKGVNPGARLANFKKVKKELEDADQELREATADNEYLLEAFGFLKENQGDKVDTGKTLAEAYKEAQKAWLDAKKAVADADKNRADYTEAQYKQLVVDLDDAEKRFKALGGVTSSKAQTDAEKNAKAAAEKALQLEYDAQQATINMMAEGTEKKVAQIELDYRKRTDAITKAEADLAAKQGTALTEAQQALFQTMREGSANDYAEAMNAAIFGDADAEGSAAIQKMEAERKAWNEYLEEYGTYQEKRKAITIRYNEAIAAAETEGERRILAKERERALANLDNAMAGRSNLWIRLFADADKMSNAQLKSIIADTKQLLDYLRGASKIKPIGFTDEQLEQLRGNAQEIGKIYEELYEKQAELDKRNEYPFSNVINAFKKLKEARELDAKAAETQDEKQKSAMLDISAGLKAQAKDLAIVAASKAAETINSIADAFMRLADATNNDNLKESAEKLGAIAQNIGAAAQGAASGGWIGAIVGGATDMLSQTIEAIVGVEAEQHEFEQNRLDFLREYQQMLLELKDEDYDSVFGADKLRKARDAWEKMVEAERLYMEATTKELGEYEGKVTERASSGMGVFFSLTHFVWGKTTAEYKAYLDAVKKGYTELEAMQVKTLDRSGWANFWGAQDQYTSLKELAPQLWDEDGMFNVDAARIFLETNTQITDEQRKQIENVIALKEKYDEALAEIDSQIADVFGALSSDITDIIFDSVRNGTDAWDEFGEKGSEIIDKLGKQMIQELYVQAYLDQYLEPLREAFASGDSAKIADVTNDIFDNMGMMFDGASAAAAAWDANAEAMGFDMDGVGQEATARGFQAMSQDTGDELNGRFTDIQVKTTAINEAVQYIKSLSVSQLQQTTSISETLAQIHNDTSLIEKHTRELSLIREGIDRMNRNIENI